MNENNFQELEYKGEGRSLWLGSPEEVLAKIEGIPMPPAQVDLKEAASIMIEPDDEESEIKAHEFENLDARYLYLPDGLRSIGNYAFSGCLNLESIVIPDSVEHIGEGAFMHCAAVENIDLPEGVKSILPYTFLGMRSLDILSFTKSVKEIHLSAFLACEKLNYIVFYGKTKDWKKIKFIGDKEILKGIYITCAYDRKDTTGIDAWSNKFRAFLKEGKRDEDFRAIDDSRQAKSDALMAELNEIVDKIIKKK